MMSSSEGEVTGTLINIGSRIKGRAYVALSTLRTMIVSGLHVQLVVNTLLYFFIFVCGFAISIPIGVVTVSKFPCNEKKPRNIFCFVFCAH